MDWLRRVASRAIRTGRRLVNASAAPATGTPALDPVRQRYIERRGFIITDLVTATLAADEKFTILDGGALDALSDPRWRAFDKTRVRLYGFEPNDEEVAALNAAARESGLDHHYFASSLWSTPGTQTFYANKAAGGGSLYAQNTALTDRWKFENSQDKFYARDIFYPTSSSQWRMTSLDHWAKEQGGRVDIDFMKLNVQGAELEILSGAEGVLDQTVGIMVEMSFVESYKRRPFFADIDRFLREKQFSFFDFIGHHYIGRAASPITVRHLPGLYPLWGQLIEGHGIYFRDPIDMATRGHRLDHWSEPKLLKLVAFAEIFGQIEFAFELLIWLAELLDARADTTAAARVRELTARAELLYLQHMI